MAPEALKIEFPQDELKTLIGGWVINQMTEEHKEKVLAQAIDYLLTPKKESWQQVASSPLNDAFVAACRNVMQDVANELVRDNAEVRAKIGAKLGEALMAWLEGNGTDEAARVFADEVAMALSRAMRKSDY